MDTDAANRAGSALGSGSIRRVAESVPESRFAPSRTGGTAKGTDGAARVARLRDREIVVGCERRRAAGTFGVAALAALQIVGSGFDL